MKKIAVLVGLLSVSACTADVFSSPCSETTCTPSEEIPPDAKLIDGSPVPQDYVPNFRSVNGCKVWHDYRYLAPQGSGASVKLDWVLPQSQRCVIIMSATLVKFVGATATNQVLLGGGDLDPQQFPIKFFEYQTDDVGNPFQWVSFTGGYPGVFGFVNPNNKAVSGAVMVCMGDQWSWDGPCYCNPEPSGKITHAACNPVVAK